MSTCKANNFQIGQSLTASQNFTWYQPSTPDGTVRLGNGNSGSVSDVITVGTTGNLTFANSVSLSAASTKTLTLNGGAGSNGLVLDASNNVGIGTSSPSGLLNTYAAQSAGSYAALVMSANNLSGTKKDYVRIVPEIQQNTAGAEQGGFYIKALTVGTEQNVISYTGASGNATLATKFYYGTAGGVAATIDYYGNLGLGVTPSVWGGAGNFDLMSGAGISFGQSGGVIVSNAYYNAGWKYKTNQYAVKYDQQQNAGQHIWYNAPSGTAGNAITFTQAMTLDASGNLLVGATSNTFSNKQYIYGSSYPAPMLGMYDTGANVRTGIGLYNNNFNCGIWLSSSSLQVTNSASYTSTTVEFSVNTTNGTIFANNLTGGATTLSVDASGNIIRTPSDRSLKTKDVLIPYGLTEVNQMRPIIHDWTPEANMGGGKAIGFIAQEMVEIIPEIVSGDVVKSLDYPKLTAVLVKAIQELSAELNELKKRIN